MFKIGDFSRLAQVSVRMLRHYDKLGLLTPSHIDKFTGYRYYTIDQLARLNRILALNGLGLTLQEIADLLGDGNEVPVDQLRGMLVLRRKELERELADKRWQLASVEARLQQIEQENDPDPYEVIVKSLEPLPVASIRLVSPTVQEVGYYCNTIYGQLYRRLREHGIELGEPEVTFYHNEEYADTDIDMEVATAIDGAVLKGAPVDDALIFRSVPGCDLAAALIFEGAFEDVVAPIQSLLRWIGLHKHVPAGPLRELHLSGPAHKNEAPDSINVIELQVPIAPIAGR
ncbi:MAG: MerR family transcriptional regulator [Caldilineaceae bacterium]|nr:MerR family transcriptional regulator [Caldilineaceae bacterium]